MHYRRQCHSQADSTNYHRTQKRERVPIAHKDLMRHHRHFGVRQLQEYYRQLTAKRKFPNNRFLPRRLYQRQVETTNCWSTHIHERDRYCHLKDHHEILLRLQRACRPKIKRQNFQIYLMQALRQYQSQVASMTHQSTRIHERDLHLMLHHRFVLRQPRV